MTICGDQSTGGFKLFAEYYDKPKGFLQGFEAFTFDRDDNWRTLKLPSHLQELVENAGRLSIF